MSLAHATRDNPTAAAHRIGSDDEALETARELAALFARESIQRDRERRLPLEELELFSRSGLWGIAVPREYGGAGVSRVTLAKVVAIVSAADSSLGQIPQNHFYALEVLRVNGSPAQKGRLFGTALAGERFGNALAEIGTRTASERRTVRERARPWVDSGVDKASDDPLTIHEIGRLAIRLHAAEALLERAGRVLDRATAEPDAESVAAASIAVAEARALTTEVALLAGSKLIELGGSRACLAELGLDRHWRNARVHTLHDPVRWKYHAVGDYYLNGRLPPRRGTL